jgi:hypothetical protein
MKNYDDDATLDAAFTAFWGDAKRRVDASAYASVRQAFKNGVALPLARFEAQGKLAIDQLAEQEVEHSVGEAKPWFATNMNAHPEWGEVHQHALVAGFISALVLWRIGSPLAEQMEAFQSGSARQANN